MVGSRFEPHPRPWRHYDVAPPDARSAAVWCCSIRTKSQWHLPLTLRPAHMVDHAAQVSLPGGAVEPGETAAQAAIREFHEELGDDGQPHRPAGHALAALRAGEQLSGRALRGGRPGAAAARRPIRPKWKRCWKCRSATCSIRPISAATSASTKATTYSAPHFLFQSYRIWGATCMILGELVTVLEEMRNLNP